MRFSRYPVLWRRKKKNFICQSHFDSLSRDRPAEEGRCQVHWLPEVPYQFRVICLQRLSEPLWTCKARTGIREFTEHCWRAHF